MSKIQLPIIVPIGVFVVIAFIVYLKLRDTPKHNLRKAEKYHELGQKHYEKGDTEKSRLYYEVSNQYRQKALKVK